MHRPTIFIAGTFVVRENSFMIQILLAFISVDSRAFKYETDNSEFYMKIKFKCILNQDG